MSDRDESPRAAIRRAAAELADDAGRVVLTDLARRLGLSKWAVYYHVRHLRAAGCFPYVVSRRAYVGCDRDRVRRLLAAGGSADRVAAAFAAETGRRIGRTTVRRIRDED